ncbi:kinase-like protein [Hesseltinella vesiculosa]|uniref:non-specific serine/threonine protein kinase n=1 Tax=Hesseltinella vesiculosa TaxID=101127 RepID=A0A1X2G408_9FUNG|nr:kinase-like protein [Hesseltinella vesiculosa]
MASSSTHTSPLPPPINTTLPIKQPTSSSTAVTDLDDPNHPLHHHRRTVNDFEYGHALGEGSYSTVIAAKDKKTDKQYAIKKLDKAHIVKNDKVKYVMIERDALSRMNHLGIVKLYWTFRDNRSLYYVLDLAPNGELYSLIRRKAPFDMETTRFYAAELLLALEHIHDKGVVHRDIKPENILLDDNMHIKITDFGSAKFLEQDNKPVAGGTTGSSRSFVGTAEYVSPELLRSEPTLKEADWWAFGCVVFQMLSGKSPFKAATDYLIFQKIKNLEYEFPDAFPPVAKDLVQRLLVLAPEKRLGGEALGGVDAIKNHAFFQGFDWQQDIFKQTAPELALQYRDDLKWQQHQQEKLDEADDFETWFHAGDDHPDAPPQPNEQPQDDTASSSTRVPASQPVHPSAPVDGLDQLSDTPHHHEDADDVSSSSSTSLPTQTLPTLAPPKEAGTPTLPISSTLALASGQLGMSSHIHNDTDTSLASHQPPW